MQPPIRSSSKNMDRNLAERNRRIHMKYLFSMLASLILPEANSKADRPPLHELLNQATTYIKHLQERIQKLEEIKELLRGCSILPVVDARLIMDSTLEVNLISGTGKNFMLRDVISILEEEGAKVVNVSYSNVGDRIFYTIHCEAISSRIGIEISTLDEKLKKLVLSTNSLH